MEQPPCIYVRKHQTLHRVNYSNISYINAEGNYCYLILDDQRKHAVKISLRQLVAQLPPEQFIRIHKSYVINLDFVTKFDFKARQAYLGTECIPIGRTYVQNIMDRILVV
ncbi:MAG: LytTR family DNA-binding domain-containing protein [Bacteroidota bacterium]